MSPSDTNRAKPLYASAYDAHYTNGDLVEALRDYEEVISVHPDSVEAGYSTAQVLNIVNSLLSKRELVDVYLGLARKRLAEHASGPPTEPDSDLGAAAQLGSCE